MKLHLLGMWPTNPIVSSVRCLEFHERFNAVSLRAQIAEDPASEHTSTITRTRHCILSDAAQDGVI